MTLRAVFLDVGGTLLSEVPSRYTIYAEVAQRYGVAIESDAMRRAMGEAHHALPLTVDGAFRYSDPWFRAFIARVFGGLGVADDALPALTDELFERFESRETFRLYPGASELVEACRASGLVVGVVSNWSARLPRVLDAVGLGDAFDFVLCSAIEGVEKPDPALFLRALERAGVAPEEALHAGDHPRLDVDAANRVGITGILVDHGGTAGTTDASGTGSDSHAASIERVTSLPALASRILGRT